MGSPTPPYRPQTFFLKLGPSTSRKLYEISASKLAWAMSCVFQLDGVQWLHSYTISQLLVNMYFVGMIPRVDEAHKPSQ